ncbi:MAG: ABC transporter permease [Candidatus Eremiobacteraeota bacterium]|nr:ABC transporter permease [Candidatus Eremiobacteraeota bacterium]MBC5827224.1 ABC transporter permease [Candidatus Eremiobacteraeota bacterium]
MSFLKLVALHFRVGTAELLRTPSYVVFTMAFPTLFYVFFGLPNAGQRDVARFMMASFAAYAVIGVALFQFGVSIAQDRASSWESFLRILPVSFGARLFARVLSALLFAAGAAGLVIATAEVFGKARISLPELLSLMAGLLVGGACFSLLGIALGYFASPKAAVPLANLIYLPLAFVGGLWIPPQFLPKAVAAISTFVPTRNFGDIVWAAVTPQPWPMRALGALTVYAAFFAILAFWGYRRDEGQHYT